MFGEMQKINAFKNVKTTTEIKDAISLICGDAMVVFDREIVELYYPYRYSSEDEMPSHRARQAVALRKSCQNFFGKYLDKQVEIFSESTSGLSEFYSQNRGRLLGVIDDGFVVVEQKRRQNDLKDLVHPDIKKRGFFDSLGIFVYFPILFPAAALIDILLYVKSIFSRNHYYDCLVATLLDTANRRKNQSVRNFARDEAKRVLDRIRKTVE